MFMKKMFKNHSYQLLYDIYLCLIKSTNVQCGSMISFSNEVENYWLNNCQVLSGPNILLVICIALIPHFHWDPQPFTFFGVNFI